jgi:DNA transposition AAA+ family ATPase
MVTAEASQNGADPIAIPSQALSEHRFGIGRDALNKALDQLELPKQRSSIEWFWRYCAEHNVGRVRLGELVRKPNGEFYSTDSVYQLLTGRRTEAGANISPMLRAIEEFRAQVEPNPRTEAFIETRMARQIWSYCQRAKKLGRIGFIFGNMSIGKSEALAELARHDVSTLYTRMKTRGQLGDYLKECAGKMAMSPRSTVANLRDRVIDGFPELLIVDEADQCFQSIRNSGGLATLDFIREGYDRKRCGVVLVMDHHGRNEVLRGDHSNRLKRLWRRRIAPLQLPSLPHPEDLNLFAGTVGLPPAAKETLHVNIKYVDDAGVEHTRSHGDSPRRLQDDVVGRDGIGVWLMLLNDAAELAREARKPISWGAVLKAHALFVAMEIKTEEK